MKVEKTDILKDITCPECGCKTSRVIYCDGFSGRQEGGECTQCGALTYQIWLERNPSYIPSDPTVACPFCHSTNCKKISTSSKVGKVLMWGVLAADSVGKTWHCNNCGSNFG